MPTGTRVDSLPALPLPPLPTDRMLVSRGGLLKRQNLSGMHGGLFTRKNVVKPTTSDFSTWVNQGSATLTDNGDVLSLEHPNTITSGANLKGRERALPSGNWDVVVGCRRLWHTREYFTGGIFLRETSSNKIELFGFGHGSGVSGVSHSRYTNPTTFFSDRRGSIEYIDIAWFRFRKWAGQFMPLFSADGMAWAQFDAGFALNNFFTSEPDRWGVMIQPLNNVTPAVAQRMDVFDWSEETDTDLYPHFCNFKNADGDGARTSRITVTTDATLTDGTIDRLVDGGFRFDSRDGMRMDIWAVRSAGHLSVSRGQGHNRGALVPAHHARRRRPWPVEMARLAQWPLIHGPDHDLHAGWKQRRRHSDRRSLGQHHGVRALSTSADQRQHKQRPLATRGDIQDPEGLIVPNFAVRQG